MGYGKKKDWCYFEFYTSEQEKIVSFHATREITSRIWHLITGTFEVERYKVKIPTELLRDSN